MATMKQEEIRREVIAIVQTWSEDSFRVAQEAQEVLGYGRLKAEQADGTDDRSLLQRALSELGIELLNKDDVERYKREKQNEVARAKFEEWIADPNRAGTFFTPSWNQHKIQDYRQPIPEFVLNKAIQIKKACPDAIIKIEQLEETPDPFLIVGSRHPKYESLMDEEFYVEVWAEPKFEGSLR